MANYIDKQAFTQAISDYRKVALEADEHGVDRPEIPRYIAECFMMLANKTSRHQLFVRYSYREDMVCEAIMTCVRKVTNFNPDNSSNAFAYYTTVCWNSFIEFLKAEKKEAYIKAKSFYNALDENGDLYAYIDETTDEQQIDNSFIPYFDVDDYEKRDAERRLKTKKAKAAKDGLQIFEEDETIPEEPDQQTIDSILEDSDDQ